MGELSDLVNGGGRNGEGLFEEEYVQPEWAKGSFGHIPAKRKVVDPRDGMTPAELRADFLENGFR